MKIKYLILVSIFTFGLSSCDFNLQDSPNALTPDQADPDFLLNSIQFGLNEYFFEVTDWTMEAVRMIAMEPRGGTYATAHQPQDFDDMWEQAYAGILSDCANLIPVAEEKGLFIHSGIARTIQAYTIMSLVDFFGDVPWEQALDPENFNPAVTPGADVYAAAAGILDAAIADFDKESLGTPSNDLFFGGSAASWISLANTLKLRLYLNTDNTTEIQRLIDNGSNFISGSNDFAYPFSSVGANPDSRHPYFGDNYLNGANDYQANYFMALLAEGKSVPDPRLRYFIYRQTLNDTEDVNELACIVETAPAHYPNDMIFCRLGNGYWGRDHIDTDGIPPDNLLRSLFGVYPIGGAFDADNGTAGNSSSGLGGAGIHPYLMTFSVDFMLAESAVNNGTTGDARALLESGVRGSIAKVMDFGASQADPAFTPTPDDIEDYVAEVLASYDAATTDKQKLDVIGTEHYIACYGNGLEAYNIYRRTSAPSNIQFALSNTPGSFIRSFPYPSNSINRNANISSKGDVGVKVFWDNNSDNLR